MKAPFLLLAIANCCLAGYVRAAQAPPTTPAPKIEQVEKPAQAKAATLDPAARADIAVAQRDLANLRTDLVVAQARYQMAAATVERLLAAQAREGQTVNPQTLAYDPKPEKKRAATAKPSAATNAKTKETEK